MKNQPFLKMPIVLTVALHLVVFALLFIHFTPSPLKSTEVNVVKANLISANELIKTSAQPPVHTSTLTPLPQGAIRKIEQVALKHPDTPKQPTVKPQSEQIVREKPSVQPMSTKPRLPESKEALILQEPESMVKKPTAKADKEQKQKQQEIAQAKEEAKKNEQLLSKQRHEEEEALLEKALKEESKQSTNVMPTHLLASKNNENQEADLESEVSAESQQLNASQTQADSAGEMNKYKQLVIDSISRRWLVPETDNNELACQLLVHVGPGGVVLNIDTLKESGDPNLDRSARNAVMKSSPLPVPTDSELFDKFRSLRLTFRPQGIVSN